MNVMQTHSIRHILAGKLNKSSLVDAPDNGKSESGLNDSKRPSIQTEPHAV